MHDDFESWLDLNGDGEVDLMEQEFAFEVFSSCTSDSSDEENDEDDADELLASVGLDRYDLEAMEEEERREALEDAGIDPDDLE